MTIASGLNGGSSYRPSSSATQITDVKNLVHMCQSPKFTHIYSYIHIWEIKITILSKMWEVTTSAGDLKIE